MSCNYVIWERLNLAEELAPNTSTTELHSTLVLPFAMPPRLPDSPDSPSIASRLDKGIRKMMRRIVKSCMKSHRIRIPKYDMPIRLRPVRNDHVAPRTPS